MSSDPNKKSARTFQCRDVLWDTFEQMARELECSVDYLINEAMKQYARQRSYGSRTPFPGGPAARTPTEGQQPVGQGGFLAPPTPPPPAGMRGGGAPLPPPPTSGRMGGMGGGGLGAPPPHGGRSPGSMPVPPPPPPRGGGGHLGVPTPPPRGHGGGGLGMPPPPRSAPPPGGPRSVPPPLPRGISGMPPSMGGGMASSNNGAYGVPAPGAALNVIYQGEKVSITKDRFVIGRGKQSSDLTLKDPNVSRQHAMIEFQNGVYFMVDMGSTNGVEYNGQRIARKQIAEGDVFRICDHDLFFTYR